MLEKERLQQLLMIVAPVACEWHISTDTTWLSFHRIASALRLPRISPYYSTLHFWCALPLGLPYSDIHLRCPT